MGDQPAEEVGEITREPEEDEWDGETLAGLEHVILPHWSGHAVSTMVSDLCGGTNFGDSGGQREFQQEPEEKALWYASMHWLAHQSSLILTYTTTHDAMERNPDCG